MTQIRYEKDADLSLIRGKKVAIIAALGGMGVALVIWILIPIQIHGIHGMVSRIEHHTDLIFLTGFTGFIPAGGGK